MYINHRHDWNISAAEAIALQKQMVSEIDYHHPIDLKAVKLVAGVDVSVKPDPETGKDMSQAAVVVLSFPDMQVVETSLATMPTPFPYIPGLLSFREIPPLLSAWKKVRTRPDVIIVDGQGIAHPRRFGIASHLGLVLGVPTIGCAKSRLCGEFEEPGPKRGSWSPLTHKGELVGAALRTRDSCGVVYVSTGHRVGLESAISVVLACAPRYRLPEPQRLADHLTRQ